MASWRELTLVYGNKTCKLCLFDGAEPDSLSRATAAKFGLGDTPFYLTWPDSDGVVPLSAGLPDGLTLVVKLTERGGGSDFEDAAPPERPKKTTFAQTPDSLEITSTSSLGPASSPSALRTPLLEDLPESVGDAGKDGALDDWETFGDPVNRSAFRTKSAPVQRPSLRAAGSTSCLSDIDESPGLLPRSVTMPNLDLRPMQEHAEAMVSAAQAVDRFSRLSTDLANERTLLAWIRTCLAVLRTAFGFIGLTAAGHIWEGLLYYSSIAMAISVVTTLTTGWMRYRSIQHALRMPEPPAKFGRISVNYTAIVIATSSCAYVLGTFSRVWAK
eukprot:TRINITY_DN15637_c0_g1_i1.p2 TRINITY_DN15637_c0_g1~~TRINITY_DN15637_c0_g1_i1.p2  ORF type:complete len:329 (+),score=57.16 TRINITY_DN15637_c0_g1_i1:86-1072(+)